jgi:hypothetical protein
MKYPVTRFKSMEVALKQLEPFVKNGAHLQSGKPFEKFGGMRSREILANWLLCATINAVDKRQLTFSSDPIGSDGIVQDGASGETWPTEHVMVPRQSGGENADAQALILAAIEQKGTKGGAAYASGKTLVVLLDADASAWHPNRVARALPNPLHFEAVWVVGLQKVENGAYIYGVTHLDVSGGNNAPTFLVRISKDFDTWEVTDLQ